MKGFTLIEILVVFSVMAVLSIIGVASFVAYNQTRELHTSALDLVSILNVAKSRSQTQVKPVACGVQKLLGYQVTLCGVGGSACLGPDAGNARAYELQVLCQDLTLPPIQSRMLSPGLSFDTATQPTFIFPIFTSQVNLSGGPLTSSTTIQIDNNSTGDKRIITIFPNGKISL